MSNTQLGQYIHKGMQAIATLEIANEAMEISNTFKSDLSSLAASIQNTHLIAGIANYFSINPKQESEIRMNKMLTAVAMVAMDLDLSENVLHKVMEFCHKTPNINIDDEMVHVSCDDMDTYKLMCLKQKIHLAIVALKECISTYKLVKDD